MDWVVLLPPVVAIGLALWTRQVFLSLITGLLFGTTQDELVLSVTVLVFLALAEVVVTSRLVQNGRYGRIEMARRIDHFSRWIYLAAVIVALLVFFK